MARACIRELPDSALKSCLLKRSIRGHAMELVPVRFEGMTGRIPHDHWAQWYDAIYEATFGDTYRWLTDETLRTVSAMAKPGDHILDIGAATGRLSVPLASAGYRVHAVDRSPAMLHRLLVRAAESGVGTRVTAQCVTAHEIDYDSVFDIALCVFTVILYVPDRLELYGTLRAIASALRIGGHLLLDIPRRDLFVGYQADNEAITREVRLTADASDIDGRRFAYRDDTYLKAPFFVRVSEHFDATWWPEDEVLAAATHAGFSLAADVSHRFARAASTHGGHRRDR
jgi:2-polyprenyl-3-methyl-5-hydroxy-6-metoxy-1,4-benzoquinol methylase